MRISTHVVNNTAKINLFGRFDFSANHEFKSCTSLAINSPEIKELELNLAEVNYIDSAALGMLLVLRETADKSFKRITLTNCKGTVAHILNMANFSKLFTIK